MKFTQLPDSKILAEDITVSGVNRKPSNKGEMMFIFVKNEQGHELAFSAFIQSSNTTVPSIGDIVSFIFKKKSYNGKTYNNIDGEVRIVKKSTIKHNTGSTGGGNEAGWITGASINQATTLLSNRKAVSIEEVAELAYGLAKLNITHKKRVEDLLANPDKAEATAVEVVAPVHAETTIEEVLPAVTNSGDINASGEVNPFNDI